MKLLCRRCGAEVEHTCTGRARGQTVVPCPLKGVIWVYVTDLAGDGLGGVKVEIDGAEAGTDKTGFTQSAPLEEGSKRIELLNLGAQSPEFYMPESIDYVTSTKMWRRPWPTYGCGASATSYNT